MKPRGGRRITDRDGDAPMIVVIDEDSARRDAAEAILAARHFAVMPFYSVDDALWAMRALRAEAVVASAAAAQKLRVELPTGRAGTFIPLLPLTSGALQTDSLVDSLRRLLRRARQSDSLRR